MYNYETLSPIKRAFVDQAVALLDISESITTTDIELIMDETGLNKPQWLVVPENRISRGVYKFPGPRDSNETVPGFTKKIESDEDIAIRIREKYETMEELVKAVSSNAVNSLVIAGAAGLGKSYTVNKTLTQVNGGEFGFNIHRGYLRATHLFRLLWENRQQGQTVVIDDCDSIFSDETALNLLKAALELKETRRIGWGSEKEFVDEDGEIIPRYFNFEGSVIFLTNLAIHDLIDSNSKFAPHLMALESRSLVLDLGIKTKKEYMIKIRQTVDAGMLRQKGLTRAEGQIIVDFMDKHRDNLRELSLRMCEKLAALYMMNPHSWEKIARSVCLKCS